MSLVDRFTVAYSFRFCWRRNQKRRAPRPTAPTTQPTTMPPMAPPDRVFESFVVTGVEDPDENDADDVGEADDDEVVEFDSPGAAARIQPILEHVVRSMMHGAP